MTLPERDEKICLKSPGDCRKKRRVLVFQKESLGFANASALTFKARVERFWDWYRAEAGRLYATIDAKQSSTLSDEITGKVQELGLGAWVFGPGANGIGHSLTVTGKGELHRQLLAIYWASRAPQIPGWTFYPSRQPGKVEGHLIKIGENKFDPIEFWLVPTVNVEDEKIDLEVWHPMYPYMDDQERYMVLFLFLDESLGEYGTQGWIGKITFNANRLGEAIPITELKDLVGRVKEQNDWKELAAGESTTLFELKEPHNHFRRGDVAFISTMNPALLNDYLEAEGNLADPLEGTGADYIYVQFDREWLPKGREVDTRGQIEDALDEELRKAASGRLIGAAMGTNNAYIDLMIFDGANSIEIVRRIMEDLKLPSGSSINYSAKEKAGWRIVL